MAPRKILVSRDCVSSALLATTLINYEAKSLFETYQEFEVSLFHPIVWDEIIDIHEIFVVSDMDAFLDASLNFEFSPELTRYFWQTCPLMMTENLSLPLVIIVLCWMVPALPEHMRWRTL